MSNSFPEALSYLDRFINYEKRSFFSYSKSISLARARALFVKLGLEYSKLKAIHIAGTKGKGSCAAFCAHILAAAGFRAGLYTSPHFRDVRERIKIVSCPGGRHFRARMISEKDFCGVLGAMKPAIDDFRIKSRFGSPTFFEIYTALAFKYFIDKKVDFVVLETGLGGRLDATNVIVPSVSVITPIGYDHVDKLGKTLSSIAREKSGIIKAGVGVVCAPQPPEALRVIRRRAADMSSPLFLLTHDFGFGNLRMDKSAAYFDYFHRGRKIKKIMIYPAGKYQAENACLAIRAAAEVMPKKQSTAGIYARGLGAVRRLEGRFEVVKRRPLVVLDVAHNSLAFKALQNNINYYFPGKRVILIFAAATDKDVKRMLQEVRWAHIIFTQFKGPRAMAAAAIAKNTGISAPVTANPEEALRKAQTLYSRDSLILISGSLFLAAEAGELFSAARRKRGRKVYGD